MPPNVVLSVASRRSVWFAAPADRLTPFLTKRFCVDGACRSVHAWEAASSTFAPRLTVELPSVKPSVLWDVMPPAPMARVRMTAFAALPWMVWPPVRVEIKLIEFTAWLPFK